MSKYSPIFVRYTHSLDWGCWISIYQLYLGFNDSFLPSGGWESASTLYKCTVSPSFGANLVWVGLLRVRGKVLSGEVLENLFHMRWRPKNILKKGPFIENIRTSKLLMISEYQSHKSFPLRTSQDLLLIIAWTAIQVFLKSEDFKNKSWNKTYFAVIFLKRRSHQSFLT